MIKLRVPATSANMGAGFDTLGVAVGLYNRMMIEEIPEGLEVINKNTQSFIPQDTSNLFTVQGGTFRLCRIMSKRVTE